MRESTWRRARRDTEDFRGSFRFWVWEVVGVGVSGAVAALALLPDQPSGTESVLYPMIGVIVGALAAYALIYLFNLALAPIRQRNEAWATLDTIQGSPESPISPTVTVFVRPNDDDRMIPAAKLGRAAGQLAEGKMLSVPVQLSATNDVLVEQMALDIAGTRAPSSWESDWLSVGVPTIADVNFRLPDEISDGRHDVKLVAYADGNWWASNYFPVIVGPVALPEEPE